MKQIIVERKGAVLLAFLPLPLSTSWGGKLLLRRAASISTTTAGWPRNSRRAPRRTGIYRSQHRINFGVHKGLISGFVCNAVSLAPPPLPRSSLMSALSSQPESITALCKSHSPTVPLSPRDKACEPQRGPNLHKGGYERRRETYLGMNRWH